MLISAVRHLFAEAFVPLRMVWTNHRLRRSDVRDPDIPHLGDADLEALVESEAARAKELDEKLQKVTASLSVAVAVGGLVGQTLLQDLVASTTKMAAAFIFLVAAAYFATGVLVGFGGLRGKERYGYGAAYRRIRAAGGDPARQQLEAAVAWAQRDNIIRSNEATAAAMSIRNGIVAFAIALLIGTWAAVFGKASVKNAGEGRAASIAVVCRQEREPAPTPSPMVQLSQEHRVFASPASQDTHRQPLDPKKATKLMRKAIACPAMCNAVDSFALDDQPHSGILPR
jgi:hypothetical protein